MGRRTNTAVWSEKYGRWQINVQKDGKRRSFYSSKPGRTGQREANKKADEWLDFGVVSRRKTVGDVWPEYLAQRKLTTSESNWKPIESRWHTWIEPRLAKKRLEALTDQDLQAILDAACAAGRSKKTLQNLCADLSGLLKFARKCGYTSYRPEELSVPASARCKGRRILQPDGLITLLRSDETILRGKPVKDEYIHYYRLAVLTGMRPGELLGLEWADVDGATVRLYRARNVHGADTIGKNEHALRTVALSTLACRELEAQRGLTGNAGRVFANASESTIRHRWKAYCVYHGIPYCSLYELRHTFVSIAQALPEGQLKAMVGHSRCMDTYGVYAHPVQGQSAQVSAALDTLFNLYEQHTL